jgi:hypothetical protein
MLPAQAPTRPASSEAFDVVSVKRNPSQVNPYGGFGPNGFEAVAATAQQLISLAYGVSVTQILDAPSWIRSDAYDCDGADRPIDAGVAGLDDRHAAASAGGSVQVDWSTVSSVKRPCTRC